MTPALLWPFAALGDAPVLRCETTMPGSPGRDQRSETLGPIGILDDPADQENEDQDHGHRQHYAQPALGQRDSDHAATRSGTKRAGHLHGSPSGVLCELVVEPL